MNLEDIWLNFLHSTYKKRHSANCRFHHGEWHWQDGKLIFWLKMSPHLLLLRHWSCEWWDDLKDLPVTLHTNVMPRGSKLNLNYAVEMYISLLLAANYHYSLEGAGQTNCHVLSIKLNVSGVFRDRLMNCRISWKVQSKPSDYGRVCNISVSDSGLGLKLSWVYRQCCFRKP